MIKRKSLSHVFKSLIHCLKFMPNSLKKPLGEKTPKTNGVIWVNQHVLWFEYRSPARPLLKNTSHPLVLPTLSTVRYFMHTCVCACVSRCSATTTSWFWSRWARQTQASMCARPSCPGLAWGRLKLCSLSTVSNSPITFVPPPCWKPDELLSRSFTNRKAWWCR